MRRIRVLKTVMILLASTLLASAGCVGKDRVSTDTPPDGPDAKDGPPESSAFRVLITHDQTTGDEHRATFEIPEGKRFDLLLAHDPLGDAVAGVCTNIDARIEIFDPSGEKAFGFGGVQWTGPTAGHCSKQEHTDIVLEPGTWTVVFSGAGAMEGVVKIVEA